MAEKKLMKNQNNIKMIYFWLKVKPCNISFLVRFSFFLSSKYYLKGLKQRLSVWKTKMNAVLTNRFKKLSAFN
jgi:hypothetical protein